MIQNIIFITLIIIIFFFVSNEQKLNDIISKKNIQFLLILLIIYFVWQKYNIILLIILILIFIFLNIENNKYISKIDNVKELFFEYYKEFNKHNKPKKSKIKEKFSNNDEEYYDVKPIVDDNIDKDKTINQDNKKKTIEPFKEEVIKLKELYENIKTEIKKLK